MNFTIIVMILGSLGFILLGTFLLNNKYIKNIDPKDSELYKEAKSMKLSGYTNILIGVIGVICSIVRIETSSLSAISL